MKHLETAPLSVVYRRLYGELTAPSLAERYVPSGIILAAF
jgi:hypothetical protein